MAELADAQDLGSCAVRCAGSTPVTRTIVVADFVSFATAFHKRHRLTHVAPSLLACKRVHNDSACC